jgi:hypothetical protein
MERSRDFVAVGRAFVEAHFPDCDAALLAGSMVRGEGTTTSDLDIVVITKDKAAPYRESFVWEGWPIEAFVHSEKSLLDYFEQDAKRYQLSLQQMCAEGIVLRDRDGVGERAKAEAQRELAEGPKPLTQEEMERLRYTVTDLLDDFQGAVREEETYLIAHDLAETSVRLILLGNGRWPGGGKWVVRALRGYDPALAEELTSAVRSFYRDGEKGGLSAFAEDALAAFGGRLFDGFRSPGKAK